MNSNMKKYLLISLLCLAGCVQEEIISTQTREGKILGYGVAAYPRRASVNFGVVNHQTAVGTTSAVLTNWNNFANQGMYHPEGSYSVPTPYNLFDVEVKIPEIRRVKLATNQVDVITTNTQKLLVGLTYSPVTKQNYGVQYDSVYTYTVNENTSPKRIIKGRKYFFGNDPFSHHLVSSTAHGKQPFLYFTRNNEVQKMNLETGIFTRITGTGKTYFLARYNAHDDKVYLLKLDVGANNQRTFTIERINDTNNTMTTVATLPNTLTLVDADIFTMSATIHCCENKYILFDRNRFYNVNLDNGTVETVNSTINYQGLVWIND
jgi:hypothetical protein